MKITIVGGGNIGTQFAVHCAEKGHETTIFTSKPECFNNEICIVDEKGIVTHKGSIQLATSAPEEAFGEAELIILTVPSTLMNRIAGQIYKYSNAKSIIGVVPGNGGSECAFRKCIERKPILWYRTSSGNCETNTERKNCKIYGI